MNLLQIRTQFVKISGRYDLVVDTAAWADAGANYFIQAAQDMLERNVGTLPETEGRIWDTLAIGGYYTSFKKRCRVIKEIWINSVSARSQLTKIDWEELKKYYADTVANTDRGTPLYYCPAKLREVDATDKGATATFLDYTLADSKDYRGVMIFPPTDEQIDLEILGDFYQPVLTLDADTNLWTILFPDVLIKAAVYQVEVFYSSQSKVKGLLGAVGFDTSEIEKDIVAEEIQDINQIEG